MSAHREFVTGFCVVAKFYEFPTIIISIAGPNGGTKCAEVFSIEQATKLRDDITKALQNVAK